MENDHSGDEELGSPMKVRELMAILKNIDPDFLIVIGSDARSLMVVNPRPGFCQPEELKDEAPLFTAQDQRFLLRLNIK